MAIDVLLTGSVTNLATLGRNRVPMMKVAIEARDGNNIRVAVICVTENAFLIDQFKTLCIGDSVCVRGHAIIPFGHETKGAIARIKVLVTDLLVLVPVEQTIGATQ
ncbi:hypothetical protein [Caballeronia sordidicola]|uniref:Single-stranded DNA-binding protein n=1 Tax=Caballeronia sordidicola TaxID=196367 RepID=A0A242M8V1_CABSO|nr:hypothetical protein [Caballeronia sordidicola]OTP67332.1 hypothetical protein PAMC26510_31685 [Caballeronia sordidicola]